MKILNPLQTQAFRSRKANVFTKSFFLFGIFLTFSDAYCIHFLHKIRHLKNYHAIVTKVSCTKYVFLT